MVWLNFEQTDYNYRALYSLTSAVVCRFGGDFCKYWSIPLTASTVKITNHTVAIAELCHSLEEPPSWMRLIFVNLPEPSIRTKSNLHIL